MADKNFGVRRVELIGSSGTPNITSPNNLNLNANTVAISTDLTIGGQVNSDIIVAIGQSVGIGSTQPTGPLDVKGTINADYFDIANFNVTGILTASNVDLGISTFSGITTFYGRVHALDDVGINTESPTYKLELSGERAWFKPNETGNQDIALSLGKKIGVNETFFDIETSDFSGDNVSFIVNNNTARYRFKRDSVTGLQTGFVLYTHNTAGNLFVMRNISDTEDAIKLHTDADSWYNGTGNIGIGTDNPIGKLDVVGHTEVDTLNVSGLSTFNNNIDMEGDIIFGTQGDKLIFTSSNFPASGGSIEIATNGANYATIAGNSKQLRIFNDTDDTYSIDMKAGKYSWKDEDADYYALYSDGSVKLYHPGTSGGILEQKFETTHYGAGIAGTLTVDNNLDVTGVITATTATFTGTGAVGLNTGTTAQRPASPDAGMIRYNSENEQFEGYSSSWGSLGGASGSGGDAVFYENDITVTTSYTITSGKNAMSAGPITIGAGATVTIPAGSVWTIV
jgi:hypothetical protein